MSRAKRIAATFAVALALGACSETPTAPIPGPDPPGNPGPLPARVLVVNSNSETLSSVDPGTGAITVRAADLGAWPNRAATANDGRDVLIASSGDNQVEVLGLRDLAPRIRIDVGRGSNPWLAIPATTASAIVTNWMSSDVRMVVLSGSAGPPLATSPGPEGVAVLDGRAFVACTNYSPSEPDGYGPGVVDVVDLSAWRVVASIPVGKNPQDVVVDANGRVHVLCTGTYGVGDPPEEGSVHVIDPGTLQEVGSVPLGGSPGRVVAGAGNVMWVAGYWGGIRRYDAASLAPLPDPTDPALLADGYSAVAWDEVDGAAWVTNQALDLLLRVDGATLAVTGTWVVGDGPVDVLVVRPPGS